MKTCSIEGCEGESCCRDLCHRHYDAKRYEIIREKVIKRQLEYQKLHKEERASYDRKYRKTHREKINKYRKTHKEEASGYDTKSRYGIIPAQYQEALEGQGNKCAICASSSSGNKRYTRFCIDHEHVEGYKKMPAKEKMKYFRGLLCHNCNCMLKEGYEDIKTLQKYVGYLKDSTAKKLNLKYNINKSKELRQTLVSEFGNKCQICKKITAGGKGAFYLDHDHKTGKIRGLLCHNCNATLGSARDNPEILENAIRYLENYQNKKENICN